MRQSVTIIIDQGSDAASVDIGIGIQSSIGKPKFRSGKRISELDPFNGMRMSVKVYKKTPVEVLDDICLGRFYEIMIIVEGQLHGWIAVRCFRFFAVCIKFCPGEPVDDDIGIETGFIKIGLGNGPSHLLSMGIVSVDAVHTISIRYLNRV